MSFVLKNKKTNQIFSCKLVNVYDLEYYGVKIWEDVQVAQEERDSFLSLQGIGDAADWEIFEVDEHLLKMFNVKLNNQSTKRVYINENGKAESRLAES